MDNSILSLQSETRNTEAGLVQPSLLSLLPDAPVEPSAPRPPRTQAAPNDRRQSLKRFQCPEGMNYCAVCDQYKDVSLFYKNKNTLTGLQCHCKECAGKRDEKYKDKKTASCWQRRYGISVEEYQRLFDEQNGVCAICGQPETKIYKGTMARLAVDHDHETGTIRGLLCNGCNTGLGHFKDNPKLLEGAINYLKRS